MAKFLIVPTQHFSGSLRIETSDDKKLTKKVVDFTDFPWLVQRFLSAFLYKVFVGLDESSWIKTNVPMAEEKKSQRTRLIKALERYTERRAIMTGTLKTRSPLNLIDQYQFLSSELFQDNVYAFAENYVIMTTLRTQRGRRVQISQKDYKRVRTRLCNAYRQGGQLQLDFSMIKVEIEMGINKEKQMHIIAHKKYSPFLKQEELMRRVADFTMTVERKDVFDISYDKYVYKPIRRPVELSTKTKKLANQLIEVGFTDTYTLGKAPALELSHRLKDICNGFMPVETLRWDDELGKEVRDISYTDLPENPKLEGLMELLDEIDYEENQIVLWCYRKNAFRQIAKALEEAGIPVVFYSGDESDKEKDAAEAAFESGEARVFLANQASAGFGLNCLRKCSYGIWYSCGDSAEQHHQAQHRILRGQSTDPKFMYHLYVEHSIEERNIEALDVGQELITDESSKDVFWFD
jgi:hypothetical protein